MCIVLLVHEISDIPDQLNVQSSSHLAINSVYNC